MNILNFSLFVMPTFADITMTKYITQHWLIHVTTTIGIKALKTQNKKKNWRKPTVSSFSNVHCVKCISISKFYIFRFCFHDIRPIVSCIVCLFKWHYYIAFWNNPQLNSIHYPIQNYFFGVSFFLRFSLGFIPFCYYCNNLLTHIFLRVLLFFAEMLGIVNDDYGNIFDSEWLIVKWLIPISCVYYALNYEKRKGYNFTCSHTGFTTLYSIHSLIGWYYLLRVSFFDTQHNWIIKRCRQQIIFQ